MRVNSRMSQYDLSGQRSEVNNDGESHRPLECVERVTF